MDAVRGAIKGCMSAESDALNRLQTDSLIDDLVKSCKLISVHPNTIYASGIGTSGILARKLVASFNSIGVRASFIHPADALHGGLGNVTPESLIVLISKSGRTSELKNLWKALEHLRPRSILISEDRESHLGGMSEVTIEIPRLLESDPLHLVPTTSAVMTLAVIDALVSGLEVALGVEPTTFRRAHPSGALGNKLSVRFKDVMRPIVGNPAVVSLETTLKDALIAMSAGRLGACVVAHKFKLVGLITDGDVRRLLQEGDDLLRVMSTPVKNLLKNMSIEVFRPTDLAFVEVERMESSSKKFTVFPIVDNERLVGVAHLHDVLGLNL